MCLRTFVALVLALQASAAIAAEFRYPIQDEARPANWPKEFLVVETSARRVEKVSILHRTPEADGSISERMELFFSPQVLGGFAVTYCNPSDNEFLEKTKAIEIYYDCVPALPALRKVIFSSSLNPKTGGTVEVLALRDTSDLERKIVVEGFE